MFFHREPAEPLETFCGSGFRRLNATHVYVCQINLLYGCRPPRIGYLEENHSKMVCRWSKVAILLAKIRQE